MYNINIRKTRHRIPATVNNEARALFVHPHVIIIERSVFAIELSGKSLTLPCVSHRRRFAISQTPLTDKKNKAQIMNVDLQAMLRCIDLVLPTADAPTGQTLT